jgi:hypothetical protein
MRYRYITERQLRAGEHNYFEELEPWKDINDPELILPDGMSSAGEIIRMYRQHGIPINPPQIEERTENNSQRERVGARNNPRNEIPEGLALEQTPIQPFVLPGFENTAIANGGLLHPVPFSSTSFSTSTNTFEISGGASPSTLVYGGDNLDIFGEHPNDAIARDFMPLIESETRETALNPIQYRDNLEQTQSSNQLPEDDTSALMDAFIIGSPQDSSIAAKGTDGL